MFGLYRTMLAMWVVAYHIMHVPVLGGYGVFAFFILSGFLMTTIMHNAYGYTLPGLKAYASNRFLRLYPMYWAVLLFSVLVILFVSEPMSTSFKNLLYLPSTLPEILANASMIFANPFPGAEQPRLSPPTWALTIEIFYYLCIGLGASRSKLHCLVWLGLSLGYYAYTYIAKLPGDYRYGHILAASLPFCLGSMLFFYKDAINNIIVKGRLSHPVLLMGLYSAHAFFFSVNAYYKPFSISPLLGKIGFYSNILLACLVVIGLFFHGKRTFNKKWDKFFGDYSYPIYLLHWQCALLFCYLVYGETKNGINVEGFIVFLGGTGVTLLVSALLIWLIDGNIERIRSRIRQRTIQQHQT